MFCFDLYADLAAEPRSETLGLQIGQPVAATRQRQQTDNLPPYRGDHHGVERELQFSDLEGCEFQAQG